MNRKVRRVCPQRAVEWCLVRIRGALGTDVPYLKRAVQGFKAQLICGILSPDPLTAQKLLAFRPSLLHNSHT
jgi:hypothetical protein